jgi:hypothetical protein
MVQIVRFPDVAAAGLHRETKIDMTDPAGIAGTMHPMLEHDRRYIAFFGIVIDDYIPELIRPGHSFLHTVGAGHSDGRKQEQQHCDNKTLVYHRYTPSFPQEMSDVFSAPARESFPGRHIVYQ